MRFYFRLSSLEGTPSWRLVEAVGKPVSRVRSKPARQESIASLAGGFFLLMFSDFSTRDNLICELPATLKCPGVAEGLEEASSGEGIASERALLYKRKEVLQGRANVHDLGTLECRRCSSGE